ncbi:MAG: ribosomal protein S18-alanine N-acetyltransferase [Desulfobacterales bacterium]|nr:ribosomal protein S18-alanine N-acetyltransferase [Desulfobacterales bacterium]
MESSRATSGVSLLLGVFTAITEPDIDAILPIESHSFQRPWGRGSFLSELEMPGAENLAVRYTDYGGHERIVAYIFFRLAADEMHILKIAVASEWRCQGIATVLMEKSLALAEHKGGSVAYLEMRPGNTAAVMLYRKLGFRVIGKRTNYYSETGEDALVMSKTIREVV